MNFYFASVFLATFAPVLCLTAFILIDRERRKKTEKPPQSDKLLRPPGYSLAGRLEKNLDGLTDAMLSICGLSTVAGLCVLVLDLLLLKRAPFWQLAVCMAGLVLFAVASALAAVKTYRIVKESENMRLGLRGEQAVAEALSEAAESGFRAFHDLPAGENWNIDHVAVGTRGVFLIETKARRRRGGCNGQAAHEVIYDGEALQFPHSREIKPIEQAKRNAAWLSDFLRNETGDPVEVFPLVVLPGWFVKRSERGPSRVNVVNANYLPGFLQRESVKIEPAQVRRIINALDKKCRDVEF